MLPDRRSRSSYQPSRHRGGEGFLFRHNGVCQDSYRIFSCRFGTGFEVFTSAGGFSQTS